MVRETRASLELIRADDHTEPENAPDGPGQPPLWLQWIAEADPRFKDAQGNPIINRIAKAGGMRRQTLQPIAAGTRIPTLAVTGEIVAMGAALHGVPDDVAMGKILRIVRRPVEATPA